jgi:heterodisulfide reductase subunit D
MEPPPHMQELLNCLQCGYCSPVCPTLAEVGWESRSPRGILYGLKRMAYPTLLDRMLRRRAPAVDEMWVRRLYQCTDCGRCARACHVDIDLPQVWADLRAWLVQNDVPQLREHMSMVSAIGGKRNYYGAPAGERADWLGTGRLPQNADIVFFAGCTMSYEQMALARATVKVLRASGANFTVLGNEEWCCGHPLLLTGEEGKFREVAAHNLAALEGTEAMQVVTGCPGCYMTLKKTYPAMGFRSKLQVLHSSELFASLLDRDRLRLARSPFKERKSGAGGDPAVIYHDPCVLGRQCGVFEAPRKLLENLPGAKKSLEFDRSRADSVCCGGGGALRAIEEEMCVRIGQKRLSEAVEMRAGIVVSACPACRINLGDAARALKARDPGVRLEVRDLVELIARAI